MSSDIVWHRGSIAPEDRARATGGPGGTVWITGLSGSGKSTIAHGVEKELVGNGRASYVLDGDNLRFGINSDLGFDALSRTENVRRVGEIARLMADAGLMVLVPIISPYAAGRVAVREAHHRAAIAFLEVFVNVPLAVCEQRDPKGLYRRARAGEISNMTGIDDPYEPPQAPDLVVDAVKLSIDESVRLVLASIEKISH